MKQKKKTTKNKLFSLVKIIFMQIKRSCSVREENITK